MTGIALIRDEADIVRDTVGHMLAQVDEVVVLDNNSTDGTREILTDLGVRVIDDPEVGFAQSRKMTRLARSLETDWIVPFDADEVWIPLQGGTIAETLRELPPAAMICEAEVFNHASTGLDPDEESPVRRMSYRWPRPTALRKVACRSAPTLTIAFGNHDARYGELALKAGGLLEVRHFPYRSLEQMIRKVRHGAAALEAGGLPGHVAEHWREMDALSDEQLREMYMALHYSEDGARLVHDPCPLSAPPRPAGG